MVDSCTDAYRALGPDTRSLVSITQVFSALYGNRRQTFAANFSGTMSVRTRRQKAVETATADEKPAPTDNGVAGAGSASKKVDNGLHENVYLFWPNLVGKLEHPCNFFSFFQLLRSMIAPGYARVILAVASLYYMPLHPRTCSFLYSISCLLDALDGYLARLFHQSTTFGSVLDMVTDRCTTACLLVFLSSAWPRWSIVFQGLISLDLASHYMHMYATLSMGGAGHSHKKVDSSRSWILHKYYTSRVWLL
jgi:CDP-diacylglycerol--inositol 3-phosphatidyltransferase